MHEIDSARGFSGFNDPAKMRTPADFQRAAQQDRLHVQLALRRRRTSRTSTRATTRRARRGRPASCRCRRASSGAASTPTATRRATRRSPSTRRSTASPYITCWNNKQARGYAGADSNLLHLGLPLADARPGDRAAHAGRRQDRRCPSSSRRWSRPRRPTCARRRSLPLALRVIGTPKDPALADAVAEAARLGRRRRAPPRPRRRRRLRARRRDPHPRRVLAALDARAVRAVVWASDAVRPASRRTYQLDNAPNNHGDHLGSAYQERLVRLRRQGPARVLRPQGQAPYSKRYCGAAGCARAAGAARRSLTGALRRPGNRHLPGRRAGKPGDQACFDAFASARPAASPSR